MLKAYFLKFLKFGIVGCLGTLIDFGTTYLCKEILKLNKFLSNAIGFTLAATSNYILNRIWTWQSTSTEVGIEYLKFFSVSIVGLGLNTLIIYLLNEKFRFNFWWSKVLATGVVMLWNFFANNFFTFAN